MHHHKPTKEESQLQEKVRDLGCIVSRNLFGMFTPGDIHHCTFCLGLGQRVDHKKVICLSPEFHRNGNPGVAFHFTGRREWEKIYGREEDLLTQTMELIK